MFNIVNKMKSWCKKQLDVNEPKKKKKEQR